MRRVTGMRIDAEQPLPLAAERWLHELRFGLLMLTESERAAILTEMRRQLAGQALVGPDSLGRLLLRLGAPARLARRFARRCDLDSNHRSDNAGGMLVALLRLAGDSLAAMVGGASGLVLHAAGAGLGILALLGCILPARTGAWRSERGLWLGWNAVGDRPAHGLLGCGSVPVALGLSVLLVAIGNRVIRVSAAMVLDRARGSTANMEGGR